MARVGDSDLLLAEDSRPKWVKDRLVLVDAKTRVERWSVRYERPINAVAVSPDGRLAAVGLDRETRGQPLPPRGCEAVRLYDLQTGLEVCRFVGHAQSIRSVCFAPDGRTLHTAATDGTMRAWRIPGK